MVSVVYEAVWGRGPEWSQAWLMIGLDDFIDLSSLNASVIL